VIGPRERLGETNDALPELVRPDWWAQASCRGYPQSWWFPDRGDAVEMALARKVCRTCPVRGDCLEYAVADAELAGVWAGTSPGSVRRCEAPVDLGATGTDAAMMAAWRSESPPAQSKPDEEAPTAMTVEPDHPAQRHALGTADAAELVECETTIEAGLQTFVEVGNALVRIRDGELYRGGYVTFQAYLQERWGFTMRHAERLMVGAEVVDSLRPIGRLPSSEGVARELAPLPTGVRDDVWEEALERTARLSDGQPNPTASEVRELVQSKLARVGQRRRRGGGTVDTTLTADHVETLADVRLGNTYVANFRTDSALIAAADAEGLLVRIDRSSPWGNPFVLGPDGDRKQVIAAYRDHYLPHKPSLQARLDELEGKVLACWCAPEPCHGHVLVELLELLEGH
jgi:hypothetical protein